MTIRHDIAYPFNIDPGLRQAAVAPSYGRHIDQLVRQVLFTNPGERINRPDFGCGLRNMVFGPNSDAIASLLQVTVIQALDKWLGTLIAVDEVKAKADRETLQVHVAYIVKQTGERRYLNADLGA